MKMLLVVVAVLQQSGGVLLVVMREAVMRFVDVAVVMFNGGGTVRG